LVGKGKRALIKKLDSIRPSVMGKVDLESEKIVNKLPKRKRKVIKEPVAGRSEN